MRGGLDILTNYVNAGANSFRGQRAEEKISNFFFEVGHAETLVKVQTLRRHNAGAKGVAFFF